MSPVITLAVAVSAMTLVATGAAQTREDPAALIGSIIRADYEGDLDALRSLHDRVPVGIASPARAARLRYWKGFALWRRAINGVNQAVPMSELAHDVRGAIVEFEHAAQLDAAFVDAKVALISCHQLLTFFEGSDVAQVGSGLPPSSPCPGKC
jgi:hypothetical protein